MSEKQENDLILLVDDDRMNLKTAQEILQKENYSIAATLSGEQAIRFLEKNKPILILLDIRMPGMDGFETLEKIREVPNGKHIPVIFLTAADEVETEVRGFEMGADDFIKKPFVGSIVLKRVARAIESYQLKNQLATEVRKQTLKAELRKQELEKLSLEIIETLITVIEAKDSYTKGHSTRVARYAVQLAEHFGWEEAKLVDLSIMALLHDVGKIGVPDQVLNKPSRLTEEEFATIKNHTVYGYEILKRVSSLKNISVTRHHHERYDGKGYPDGLAGEAIPYEARIVGIADAFDAMTSNRIYRKALTKEEVHSELEKGRGTQFDPQLLDIFLEMYDKELVKPLRAQEQMGQADKIDDVMSQIFNIEVEK